MFTILFWILSSWWCLFHGTERNGTKRNAGLLHGTDKCDDGTINLILEYLTRNGYYIVLINI